MSDIGRAISTRGAPLSRSGDYPAAQTNDGSTLSYSVQHPTGDCYTLLTEIVSDGTLQSFEYDIAVTDQTLVSDIILRYHGSAQTSGAFAGGLYLQFNGDQDVGNYIWVSGALQDNGAGDLPADNDQIAAMTPRSMCSPGLCTDHDWGILLATFGGDNDYHPEDPTTFEAVIPAFANSGFNKIASSWGGGITRNIAGDAIYLAGDAVSSGMWLNTAPITHISVTGTASGGTNFTGFSGGTSLKIYGRC